ncbi:hypothetical protein B0H17DRAFT_948965, partial [Mycena rosella]
TWEEMLCWIVRSELNGFGTGLAPLQFANNMVLAGIAESAPPPATMAQWIFANRTYGAFSGLKVFGFNLHEKKASPAEVRAAFCCFYYWLEYHLSSEDKAILHFVSQFDPNLIAPTLIDEHVTPVLVARTLHADGITWEDFAG